MEAAVAVLEMSDIVLLITDIRHPVVNFPPALYEYVTGELGLALVLVLNKVDLAPPALVVAWKHYFHQRYPQLHIVLFTSFPRDTRTPQEPGGVLKKNRRRGKGWTRALGPEQLLRACEAITVGKVDLSSWREKIARDVAGASWGNVSGEEEEEEDGPAVLVEQLTDSAMEPTGPSRERYKDGVVTIGCIGFPNVGKSSLINGLVGRKVVSVSRTPGHTRYFQTYFLTPSVKLCDCPGLIFPSLLPRQLQVLAGIYPIAQIQEPYTSVGYLASRIPVQALLHLRHPEAEDLRLSTPGVPGTSVKLGQRNVVIKRPRQLEMTCTEQPIAYFAWQWMAASAYVSTLLATANREAPGSLTQRLQSWCCRRAGWGRQVMRRRKRRRN
nr:GTP-binding protein MMR1 - mouse [Mus musculus]